MCYRRILTGSLDKASVQLNKTITLILHDIYKLNKNFIAITFLHTTHSIERESLAEFIGHDKKYRLGIRHLLQNYKKIIL